MRLPTQSPAVARRGSTGPHHSGIDPSGCSFGKKIACVAAAVACGAVCVGTFGSPACLACVSSTVGGCADCF